MNVVDRVLGWLLIVGALLHAGGSWAGYRQTPELLLWSLSGSVAALLLAVINLLRVNRPNDRGLAWTCFFGCIAWVAVAVGFGAAIGNVLDPRAMIHAVNAAALAGMSVRTLRLAGRKPGVGTVR